jgi:hypothetical protein
LSADSAPLRHGILGMGAHPRIADQLRLIAEEIAGIPEQGARQRSILSAPLHPDDLVALAAFLALVADGPCLVSYHRNKVSDQGGEA